MPTGISLTYGPDTPQASPWATVRVERFGRVQTAEIQLAPMTILVGRNNTGKSYIASLLWAIRSSRWGIRPGRRSSLVAPDWFREYVDAAHASAAAPLAVTAARVLPCVNNWLGANANEFAAELMSFEDATIGSLSFQFEGQVWLSPRKEGPVWTRGQDFGKLDFQPWAFSWTPYFEENDAGGLIASSGLAIADHLFSTAVEILLTSNLNSHWRNALYVPAARTGLVLAIKDLAASVMNSFGLSRGDVETSRFTLPMISFLTSLIKETESRESTTSRVADFLESSILAGQVTVEGKGAPSFSYSPTGSNMRLPMHAVSSMVTELAPVLSLLRGAHFDGGIVIEEPEAHLHLSAQRCMARALVKLANSGVPVVITTHSDTFIQQINLLMRLHSSANRDSLLEEFGYGRDETLDVNQVVAYEFLPGAEGTRVVPAEKTTDGFIISSLNETLIDLSNDVLQAAEA